MGARIYQNIEIRGVVYPDIKAAATALGVHPNTVRVAYRTGALHRVGTGCFGPKPMRVQIAGKIYDDVRSAAAHLGVKPSAIYSAISDGDPDRVARPAAYSPWKSKPFSIGALTFPSMRAASRALGFENEEYIAQVVRRGSCKGRERILAAAMAYVARCKSGEGRS